MLPPFPYQHSEAGELTAVHGLSRAAHLEPRAFCPQVGVSLGAVVGRKSYQMDGRLSCGWSPGGGHSEGDHRSAYLESNVAALRPGVTPGLSPLSNTKKRAICSQISTNLTATPHKFTSAPLSPLTHNGCSEFISTLPQPTAKLTRPLRVDR